MTIEQREKPSRGRIVAGVVVWSVFAAVLLVTCRAEYSPENQAARAAAEAERAAAEAEERRTGFHCLSTWNGHHRALVDEVRESLLDPESMQIVSTRIAPADANGKNSLLMDYRARNVFGGIVPGQVLADIDNETCAHTIIEH